MLTHNEYFTIDNNIACLIENFPDYAVISTGKIYNMRFKKYVKTHPNHNGYPQVGLYTTGKRKRFLVHRIVATHFIANPNNYEIVDHINRLRYDARVENLRWVTPIENMSNTVKNTFCCPHCGKETKV